MKHMGLLLLLTAMAVAPASAQDPKNHIMLNAADLKWAAGPPSLPAGAQVAVLEGNAGEEGIFTLRLKMPANYRIQAHWHPAWEHITVIEGSFWMGRGDAFDEAGVHEVPAGGFIAMAPGTRHYAMTKVPTVIQLHGMGPWQVIYVDPKNDPRSKKQ